MSHWPSEEAIVMRSGSAWRLIICVSGPRGVRKTEGIGPTVGLRRIALHKGSEHGIRGGEAVYRNCRA
jgi:hypothetical protein